MSPPRVKICGVTRLEDGERAVELGAWALGMILYPGSPRRCPPAEAERIAAALQRRVELCGVFVNATLDEVTRLSERIGLTMVQLHGDEGPAYCAEVARRTGARVIKAASVTSAGELQDLERFHSAFHLLDGRAPGLRGGTGRTFDWGLLRARRSNIPLILSGGLTPENVTGAIAQVRPFAVDTASGTEASPGHKDPDKLEGFFAAVARADAEAPTEAAQA